MRNSQRQPRPEPPARTGQIGAGEEPHDLTTRTFRVPARGIQSPKAEEGIALRPVVSHENKPPSEIPSETKSSDRSES